MPCFLGIDTSNYTTSCAIYDSENDTIIHRKKLLPVKKVNSDFVRVTRFFITRFNCPN